MGEMGGKTGEWGGGPAGAPGSYDVRGLHAAQGAIWAAPRGDRAQNSKIKPAPPRRAKINRATSLAHWEAVKDAP